MLAKLGYCQKIPGYRLEMRGREELRDPRDRLIESSAMVGSGCLDIAIWEFSRPVDDE